MSTPTSTRPFGHGMKGDFLLDPQFINLNHGSFGSIPGRVLDVYTELTKDVEKNPDKFIRLEWSAQLRSAREALSRLIDAPCEDCVLVSNVSLGILTILQNLEWNEDDIIFLFNTTFESISRGARNLLTWPRPRISECVLEFPMSHAAILSKFRAQLRMLKGSPSTEKHSKMVVILDSIISFPGIVMPWQAMVSICREEGAISLVDAAHSIGQETDLHVAAVSPDYWISSCSKWLYAKRACAVLYVAKRNQHLIKSAIPTALFDGEGHDFASTFEWSGTIDVATAGSIVAAIDFRRSIGGERRIYEYCHELVLRGARHLADRLKTSFMDSEDADELTACMANVELPLPSTLAPSGELMFQFHRLLLVEHKAYASQFYHNNKWWVRVSAQVYNEISDFDKLGDVLDTVCQQLRNYGSVKSAEQPA